MKGIHKLLLAMFMNINQYIFLFHHSALLVKESDYYHSVSYNDKKSNIPICHNS